MYKREIRPLSESMLDAISGTINKLEHVEESVSFNGRTFKKYKTFNSEKEANAFLEKHDDHGVIGEKGGKVFVAKNSDMGMKESVALDEAKMSDTEVLNAAKSLAKNGKDAKTKAFGKGLVDFYAKNKSFTPDQVGGLQNIMKNASFQMAEEVELGEEKKVPEEITDDDWVVLMGRTPVRYIKNPKNNKAPKNWQKSSKETDVMRVRNAKRNAIVEDTLSTFEIDEAPNTLQKITAILTKMNNGTKVVKDKAGYFHIKMTDGKNMSHQGPYHTLEDVLSALQKDMKEEVELEEKYAKATDKLDDGKGMDPVGKADADIDNDGDVDSSDEYLHKRRKAIGKAMKKRKD